MKYRVLVFICILLSFSCEFWNDKIDLVVYPEYCRGCVSKNFSSIRLDSLGSTFSVYFDTTDTYVLNEAKRNKLRYTHISKSEVRPKFGDYANVVIFPPGKKAVELSTNEVLSKGVHF